MERRGGERQALAFPSFLPLRSSLSRFAAFSPSVLPLMASCVVVTQPNEKGAFSNHHAESGDEAHKLVVLYFLLSRPADSDGGHLIRFPLVVNFGTEIDRE